MTIRRLVFFYRALLKDLKRAPSMSDRVFKRKLKLISKISRRIIEYQRATARDKIKI